MSVVDSLQIQLFRAELKHVPSPVSTLLSSYSGIPEERHKEHITTVRNRAYKSYPYPCLGRWRFLDLDLSSHPLYQSDILPALKKTSTESASAGQPQPDWILLDLGCCLGQDIRKLIFDGGDPSRIHGADLRPEFIDTGYELFQDEDKFPRSEHFVAPADVFDFSTESELSKRYDGKVGILHTTAVFHLFNWDEQVQMAKRCLQLMTPKLGKVLICGGQVGNIEAKEQPRRSGKGTRFRHNDESWKRLWEDVVQEQSVRDKIKTIEVHSFLEEINVDRFKEDREAMQGLSPGGDVDQRHIGNSFEGFRWQKWWIWVEFA
ncbi:hypothetical protein H2200_005008 [Cladophialophora chaetospira]|uniref:Methyltransferase domain-containing protein n=1 Tax=Cladophialophora chaetospira TaxID=386627 RepID=A0AA39CJE3_9EURO|nr:hypothetical protein H2200_005008 [Cladophialophora chaetospira]